MPLTPNDRKRPAAGARFTACCVALLSALSLTPELLAQVPDFNALNFEPVAATDGKLVFSFDESVEGWKNLDGGNGLTVGTEGPKEGKGALKYDYPLKKGAMSVVCRGGLSVAGAKSVSLWLKSTRATVYAMGLIEQDGSNYITMMRGTGDWQQVTRDLDEFQLTDDSKDENGTLDADQINVVGLVDGEVFALEKGTVKDTSGTLWIDGLAFSPDSTRAAVDGDRYVVDDFETLSGRWSVVRMGGEGEGAIDKDATLKIAEGADNVKAGKGALEFQYAIAAQGARALMGAMPLRLKQPRSVSVWIKTSDASMLIWNLSERDGSSYMAPVFTAPGEWQQVNLPLSYFNLDDKSKDENGQLDGDQISGMAFIDAAGMFGGLGAEPGATRTIWLDELVASAEEPPTRRTVHDVDGGKLVYLDDFEQGPPGWIGLTITGLGGGGQPSITMDKNTKLSIADKDAAAGEKALQASYFAPEAGLLALLKFWGNLPLDGATQIRVSVKSKYDAKLMIGVEERDGSGYNYQVDAAGGEKWQSLELPLSKFTLGDDKVDENGKLDPAQLKQLSLIDLSGAAGEPGPNTLWVDEVAFFVPAAAP